MCMFLKHWFFIFMIILLERRYQKMTSKQWIRSWATFCSCQILIIFPHTVVWQTVVDCYAICVCSVLLRKTNFYPVSRRSNLWYWVVQILREGYTKQKVKIAVSYFDASCSSLVIALLDIQKTSSMCGIISKMN